ncbi:MAG TPA: 50S ribosomal protein L35 [Solirubrobacterales bacterium]|nr:50S ribosomal protein L35 [Solirubrobacterales bacterium]
MGRDFGGALVLLQCRARMPKMKTHSGAKKRFKKSATGKIRGRHAYSSHILEKKSPKRKRKMANPAQIAKVDVPNVRKLLGGGK